MSMRRRSLIAALIGPTSSDGTWTSTRDAPSVDAATAAPSSTRWGRWWMRNRSFRLAGSPSAPLATTTGRLPRADCTDRHFVATGNQAPP